MKTLNIMIGVLTFLVLKNLYTGITGGFTTNRQALIAGGLTTAAAIVIGIWAIKSKTPKAGS